MITTTVICGWSRGQRLTDSSPTKARARIGGELAKSDVKSELSEAAQEALTKISSLWKRSWVIRIHWCLYELRSATPRRPQEVLPCKCGEAALSDGQRARRSGTDLWIKYISVRANNAVVMTI
jgi:hypothetical protein